MALNLFETGTQDSYQEKVRVFSRSIKDKYPQYEGVPDEQLANAMLQKYPEYNSFFKEQPKPKEKSFLERAESAINYAGESVANVVGGAVAEAPNIVADTASVLSGFGGAVSSPFSPIEGYKKGVADASFVREAGKELSTDIKAIGSFTKSYDPFSAGAKVGEVGAQIGSSIAIPGGVMGQGYKASGLAGKVLRAAGQGAIDTAKFTAVSEGRLPDATEASIGAGVSAAFPVAGKVLSSAKSKLQLSGNINPAKLEQVRKSIIEDGAKESDEIVKSVTSWQKKPELVSQWMLDRGITGSKEDMIQKLVKLGESSKGTVDESLASVPTAYKNDEVGKALASLRKNLDGVEGMESVLKKIDDLSIKNSKEGLTLAEINEVKREMDRNLSLFTIAGDVRAGNVKQGLANIRSDIRKFIETKADEAGLPNIRMLNNETAVSHKLAEAIGKKEDADAIRQLVSPFSGGLLGGLTGVGPFDDKSIEGKIGNFIFGAAIGSAANSSLLKTKIASVLNKLTPSEKGLVNAYIESRGVEALPKMVYDKVKPLFSKSNKPLPKPLPKSTVLQKASKPLLDRISDALPATKNQTLKSKGGFTTLLPGTGKADDLAEEARKYKSAEGFYESLSKIPDIKEGNYVTAMLGGKPTLVQVSKIKGDGSVQVKYEAGMLQDYTTIEKTDIVGNARMAKSIPENLNVSEIKAIEQNSIREAYKDGKIDATEFKRQISNLSRKYEDKGYILKEELLKIWENANLPGTGKADGVLDNSSKEVKELMFHTSSTPIVELKPGKILWTGTSDYSDRYGKTGSKFKYIIDPQNINILDSYSEYGRRILDKINASIKNEERFSGGITNDDGGVSSFFIQNKSVMEKLKELGFDAVKTSESNYSNTPSIGIINPEKIKIRNVSK